MKVPFTDLNAQHKEIKRQINKAMKRVLQKNDFILGEDVRLFEREFSRFCQARFAVGVSSGTAALFLALLSLDIKEGDEVIVPDFTYIATALAVSYTGAKPVFVDIEEGSYNIDVKKIERAITKHTKAIIPVHLYGQPADMPQIMKIAKKYNLKVVEDAAQAHGATIKMPGGNWQKVGGIGDIGCFSFYPTKNLGGLGDGGMIVTNDIKTYNRLLKLRDYGRVSKYEHSIIGYNSRLDTLQAAVLREKLKKLDSWNVMRRRAASTYNYFFKSAPQIITPHANSDSEHVYHVYAVRLPARENTSQLLLNKGIGVIIHYPIPIHLQKAYADLGYKVGDFPVSEKVAKGIISLPMFPHISKKQIKYVVENVKKGTKS